MKVQTRKTDGFKPFELRITFESEAEVELFTSTFDFGLSWYRCEAANDVSDLEKIIIRMRNEMA